MFVAAAILDVFGQGSQVSSARSPAATLTVDAPQRLRGGVIFEGRFEIAATQRIEHPTLRLAPGWTAGITLNTVEPAPAKESSRDDRLILTFDPIPAGTTRTVWTQWQVNPVNTGSRSQDVELLDGSRQLSEIKRNVTVFP